MRLSILWEKFFPFINIFSSSLLIDFDATQKMNKKWKKLQFYGTRATASWIYHSSGKNGILGSENYSCKVAKKNLGIAFLFFNYFRHIQALFNQIYKING